MNKIRTFLNEYKFHIFSFAAIFFLVFFTYHHVSKFGFIGFDDTMIIMKKISDMDSVAKIKNFLKQPVFDEADSLYYRPFLNLSFAIDTIISGGEMGFYHFSNMIIHIIAVFLLFVFLLCLNYSKPISLIVSLIFSVHPVLVSSVAWIPGRNDSLLAIFVFLFFIFFIKNIDTGKISYAFLAALSLLAVAFTKETVIIMPVIFFLYLFLYHKPGKKSILTAFAITVFAFSIYILLRAHTISQGNGNLDFGKMALNLFNSLGAYFWYLRIIFFLKKIYLYPRLPITVHDIAIGLILLIFLAAIAYFFRKNMNFKRIIFGLAWYFLFLAPTIVTKNIVYLNHRLYLPIIGILIILIELAVIAPLNSGFKIKKIFFALAAVIIVLFAAISYKSSFYYKDHPSFWLNAYKQNPQSYTAALETAAYYKKRGDMENTEKYLFEALNLSKGNPEVKILTAIGDFYFGKKEDARAFEYYAKAEEKNKYNEYIYLGLSRHYEMLRDKEKALAELERGLAIIPKSKLLAKRVKILKDEIPDDSYVIVMKAINGR